MPRDPTELAPRNAKSYLQPRMQTVPSAEEPAKSCTWAVAVLLLSLTAVLVMQSYALLRTSHNPSAIALHTLRTAATRGGVFPTPAMEPPTRVPRAFKAKDPGRSAGFAREAQPDAHSWPQGVLSGGLANVVNMPTARWLGALGVAVTAAAVVHFRTRSSSPPSGIQHMGHDVALAMLSTTGLSSEDPSDAEPPRQMRASDVPERAPPAAASAPPSASLPPLPRQRAQARPPDGTAQRPETRSGRPQALMAGLPRTVTEQRIFEFFEDNRVVVTNVQLLMTPDQRFRGMALVELRDRSQLDAAVALSGGYFFDTGRWVRITEATHRGAARSAARQRQRPAPAGGSDVDWQRARAPRPPYGTRTLCFRNLSADMTEDVLWKALEEVVGEGGVTRVRFVSDRRTGAFQGHGYVTFRRPWQADVCHEQLHGRGLCGRPVWVDYSETPGQRPKLPYVPAAAVEEAMFADRFDVPFG